LISWQITIANFVRTKKKKPTSTSVRAVMKHFSTSAGLRLANRPAVKATTTSVFSGIQPTGVPHLGNYLGALRQWVEIQNTVPANAKLTFCIVDLHALTKQQDPKELKRRKREMMGSLMAIGLDPRKCTLFEQSRVPAHSELMWILSCIAGTGRLSRMTQWKVQSCSLLPFLLRNAKWEK
jgi:tRNA synthetases class I (W and Y)